jgi:hypothetical protein
LRVFFFESNTQSPEQADQYTIFRQWSATDAAGNQAIRYQTIQVVDETPPVFSSQPEDLSVECECELPPVPTLFAMDNCDPSVDVEYTFVLDADLANTTTHLWNAVDRSGNTGSVAQFVTVVDTTAPKLTVVSGDGQGSPYADSPTSSAQCDSIPSKAHVFAQDNCDTNIKTDFDEIKSAEICPHTYNLVRTWSGTDHVGLTVTGSHTVEVSDTIPPSIALPTSPPCIYPADNRFVVYDIDAILDVSDNCGATSWSYVNCTSARFPNSVYAEDCYYDAQNQDIYVQAALPAEPQSSLPSYVFNFVLTDECNNEMAASYPVWVYTPEQYGDNPACRAGSVLNHPGVTAP